MQDGCSRLVDEDCSRLSQRETTVRAIEQSYAELLLKTRDRLAERRLRHAEQTGRSAHMKFVGNSEEVAKMAKFHIRKISK